MVNKPQFDRAGGFAKRLREIRTLHSSSGKPQDRPAITDWIRARGE